MPQQRLAIGRMCKLLDVSRSGFYEWCEREESTRSRSDRRLLVLIRAAFEESHRTYGSPRIHRELRVQGERVSEKRIARLMALHGLQARQPRAWRRTTDSNHNCSIAPNSLDRVFTTDRPNQVWAGDTTYIATPQGWLFLAVVLDLFSRKVVGWSLGTRLDGELACRALQSAFEARRPDGSVLFHSDQGVEFACSAFRTLLAQHGGSASMSRRGNCWDNAVVESFFSTLKSELIYRRQFESREQIEREVFRYLEGFYNQRRLHSTLGYLSPVKYEQLMAA